MCAEGLGDRFVGRSLEASLEAPLELLLEAPLALLLEPESGNRSDFRSLLLKSALSSPI
jgi:hypothetical protein